MSSTKTNNLTLLKLSGYIAVSPKYNISYILCFDICNFSQTRVFFNRFAFFAIFPMPNILELNVQRVSTFNQQVWKAPNNCWNIINLVFSK